MKKSTVIIIASIIIVLIVVILFYNKSKIAQKAKSTEKVFAYPVNVVKAELSKVGYQLSYTGVLMPNKEVGIVSEVQGKVTEVNFNIGDYINQDFLLAKMDEELKNAALISAQANYEKSKNDFERYEKLVKEKSVNESQFEGIKLAYKIAESQYITARKQFNDTKIKAPFSGIITSKLVEAGSYLNVGNLVANLVDISLLKLRLNIPEKEINKFKIGDIAKVISNTENSQIFTGKIKTINAKADESHTIQIEVLIQNSNRALKAGMFATALFEKQNSYESIVIPREAIVGSIKMPQVYIVENDIAKLRTIKVQDELQDKIAVSEGINVNDIVITNGQINLQDNTKVIIAK